MGIEQKNKESKQWIYMGEHAYGGDDSSFANTNFHFIHC